MNHKAPPGGTERGQLLACQSPFCAAKAVQIFLSELTIGQRKSGRLCDPAQTVA